MSSTASVTLEYHELRNIVTLVDISARNGDALRKKMHGVIGAMHGGTRPVCRIVVEDGGDE